MSKNQLSERYICTKLIAPTLEQTIKSELNACLGDKA